MLRPFAYVWYPVFDLPPELLASIALKDADSFHILPEAGTTPTATVEDEERRHADATKPSTTCLLCNTSFFSVEEQRQHSKSDWHGYNLKQKLRGKKAVNENDFEKLVTELDESISGSGSDTSGSDLDGDETKETTLGALLKKQARLGDGNAEEETSAQKRNNRGAGKPPLFWFSTPMLPSHTSLGIYRALFTKTELEAPSIEDTLKKKQLKPMTMKTASDRTNGVPLPSTMTSPLIFMCMVGGGHFAGMIVSLAPKVSQHNANADQRQAAVMAHKTFHRYTTRRKQGGGQSANDAAKGAAHSAGSSLRRYNEIALEQDIRALLTEWKDSINSCQLIFVRATGSSNRRIFFGPYDGQVLRQNDPRNRTFPFSTRRATQSELMRSFVELTRVKVSHVDEAALAAAAAAAQAEKDTEKAAAHSKAAPTPPPPSKEDEAAILHTDQIHALIRRSKIPALLQYLSNNSLSADYLFKPSNAQTNHHAPTPLHLAASISSVPVITSLLVRAGANPSLSNADGKVPFDFAGDRAARDAFRVARHELGESRWDWFAARIPPALSKMEAERRDTREKAELEKAEKDRRKAEEERLKKEGPVVKEVAKGGRSLGLKDVSLPKTAEEKREEEGRGMTPETRQKLERERRARAAEARMKR